MLPDTADIIFCARVISRSLPPVPSLGFAFCCKPSIRSCRCALCTPASTIAWPPRGSAGAAKEASSADTMHTQTALCKSEEGLAAVALCNKIQTKTRRDAARCKEAREGQFHDASS